LEALKEGRTAADCLPGARRLASWFGAELREELLEASPPTFVDGQDLAGRNVDVFGAAIVANGYYRTDGDRPRFWTFSFTADGRVAYLELEE
jgi:hypothetical protein